MRIIKDDLLALDLLERANIEMADYSLSQAFSFDHQNDFYLVIYSAEKKTKGFTLFIIPDYKKNYFEFDELTAEIPKIPHPFLADKACEEIEKITVTLSPGNLFFDAH